MQESGRLTLSHDALYSPGPLFDHAALLTEASELVDLRRRLELGFARPQGFVAQVGISTALQGSPCPRR